MAFSSNINNLLDIAEPEISTRSPKHKNFRKTRQKRSDLRLHNINQKKRDLSRQRERDVKELPFTEDWKALATDFPYRHHHNFGPPSLSYRMARAALKISAHEPAFGSLLSGIGRSVEPRRNRFLSLTENGAITLATSGSPLVDFFFQVLPDSFAENVREYLQGAWDYDALSALRLVFQLRDIRGGKGDREQFYVCLDWMVENHPQTLLANLEWFPQYGYWKDLLMFVLRQIEGEDCREKRRVELEKIRRKRDANNARITKHKIRRYLKEGKDFNRTAVQNKREYRREVVDTTTGKTRAQVNIERDLARGQAKKAEASARRAAERAARTALVAEKLENDSLFAALYERVVDLFVAQLRVDLNTMASGSKDISLCAKWAPRLGGSFDRRALLGRAIAKKMFPNQTLDDLPLVSADREDGKVSEEELSERIAFERYRREVCVPLRRYLECPEVLMSARKWKQVNYERTPSVCMATNGKHFYYHDLKRFKTYLADVAMGIKKIASGAVMPHDLVHACVDKNVEIADLQFHSIIRNLREAGSFTNSLAICDVSGSMAGTPMDVAVALSMILADLNDGIWRKRMITFSERPKFFVVPDGNLHQKVRACLDMDWGCSTNYHAVFNMILAYARKKKTTPADMIKRLYVFSDMEFNVSGGSAFETTHQQIVREYQEAGYDFPHIVFWNLRSGSSSAVPASASDAGVALVSGYNASLLKIFMDGTDADWTMEGGGASVDVLETVLASERYENIVTVVD